jgi:EAL domain-containing protein (putative c-di-GMP-specific phosphodiesterase class I)/ActR/RegA family two-component response regulator
MGEHANAAADTGQRPIRVVVADDDADVVRALRALISAERDLELVGTASDAETVIELAVSDEPDIVLLDVRMPGGGGLRAAREIARRCPRTRVIALSAHEDEVTVIQMMGAGAHAYVPKGASTERILREIYREVDDVPPSGPSENVWGGAQPDELAPRRDERRARILDVIEREALSVSVRPIFDISTGVLAGAEAVPRVARIPVRGADAWFAEAESVGLLRELEIAALVAAERCLQGLPEAAFISVGLSPRTLAGVAFPLALSPTTCDRIVLQITEYAPVDDYESLAAVLRGLRKDGVRIGIGDVGAGVANLRHVVNLAPDFLTIDSSLTHGVETDSARHALVAAIASCAEQLDARVIATGVTTIDQLDELTRLGVDLFQSAIQVESMDVGGMDWETAIGSQPHRDGTVRRIGPRHGPTTGR